MCQDRDSAFGAQRFERQNPRRSLTLYRALVVFLVLTFAGCREQILHDLDELRANQVQLTLLRSGIPVEKLRAGKSWSIAVPAEDVTAALAILERSRILRKDLERGAEVQGSFLQTSGERTRIFERQLALRTEQTLEQIPGVLEARVHIHSDPANGIPGEPSRAGSASVLLVLAHGANIDTEEVRTLVGGASGVKPANVSILRSEVADEPATGTVQQEAPDRRLARRPPEVPVLYGAATFGIATIGSVAAVVRSRRRKKLVRDLTANPEAPAGTFETQERLRDPFQANGAPPGFSGPIFAQPHSFSND